MTEGSAPIAPPTAAAAEAYKQRAAPAMPPGRVKIILEENENIPLGLGQFFGINGAMFHLKPGVEAVVPVGITDILNNAITHVPDVDPNTGRVAGWKRKLRYPYQNLGPVAG